MLKQFVPSEYCLKCLGCCRFAQNPTIWAPRGCRLIENNSGYICERLSLKDNRCRIYNRRPLDCRIYPFLLVRKNRSLLLGLHKSCCFIEQNNPRRKDINGYADYLKRILNRPGNTAQLRKTPGIAADYRENVEPLNGLGRIYKKACILKLNRLTLKDKPRVDKYLKAFETNISAYHFSQIFIWKDLFKISWAVIKNNLCIFYQDKIGMFMPLAPLGNNAKDARAECFEVMNSYNQNNEISRIENIPRKDSPGARLKDIEYLCFRKDLAELKGGAYKHKRSSCNHFARNYDYQLMPYQDSMRGDCLELYQLWMRQRGGKNNGPAYLQMLEDSKFSFNTALSYAKELGLSGYALKAAGGIKGCSLGYGLNRETFCILFEVCDLRLKGIAQFIFREFCRGLRGYKYINIMGSSGLENLKKVKLSYRPRKEIKSYTEYKIRRI